MLSCIFFVNRRWMTIRAMIRSFLLLIMLGAFVISFAVSHDLMITTKLRTRLRSPHSHILFSHVNICTFIMLSCVITEIQPFLTTLSKSGKHHKPMLEAYQQKGVGTSIPKYIA